MKPSTRIELIDRQAVVSLPLRLPTVYVPHAVLIAAIAFAWTADGMYELGAWVVSAL